MAGSLAEAIHDAIKNAPGLHGRPATVTSTSPLEVTLGGGTTIPASRAAGYTPVNGDVVYVLQSDQDSVFIIDKITSGG